MVSIGCEGSGGSGGWRGGQGLTGLGGWVRLEPQLGKVTGGQGKCG